MRTPTERMLEQKRQAESTTPGSSAAPSPAAVQESPLPAESDASPAVQLSWQDAVVDLCRQVEQQRSRFEGSRRRQLPDAFMEVVEKLLFVAAEPRELSNWPRWRFAQYAEKFAVKFLEITQHSGGDWRDYPGLPDAAFFDALYALVGEGCDTLTRPPQPDGWEEVTLPETLRELIAQGVPEEQIGRILGSCDPSFVNRDGSVNHGRLRKAKDSPSEMDKAWTWKHYRKAAGWPQVCPPTSALQSCRQFLEQFFPAAADDAGGETGEDVALTDPAE